jgi:hypothetical protein
MCTLSFLPDRQGYLVAMNRDEQRTRVAATPPTAHPFGDQWHVYPQEPTGGTWIGASSSGNLFALLNWYSVDTRRLGSKQKSRGEIIPGLLPEQNADDAERALSAMQLFGIHPFRLIGIFSNERQVREWRWDGQQLAQGLGDWVRAHWFSSSKSDQQAELQRGDAFAQQWSEGATHGAEWLRSLHATHIPEPGPFSVCVHRDDAATVSYTEVSWQPDELRVTYQPGNPCQSKGSPSTVCVPVFGAPMAKLS